MTWFPPPLRTSLASTLLLTSGLTAQTVWTGAASNAWSDNANWTAGVPNSISDAIIPVTSNVPNTAGSPFPAVRNLTVQAGAAFTIAASAPLDVFGSVSSPGAIAGEMRLRGGGTIATGTSGSLDTVRVVTGNYTVSDATIDDLLHDPAAGPIVVDRARVLSTAIFTGAGLVGSPGSSLECDGPLLINTTVPTTVPPETILLHADWTSSASWQPLSGIIRFASTDPLTVSAAPGTHWHDVDIQVPVTFTSDLRVDGALRMNRDVLVNGGAIDLVERAGISGNATLAGPAASSLRIRDGITATGNIVAPAAALDADGDLTFLGAGRLEVGVGLHRISNSLDMNGAFVVPAGSTVEFDGSGIIALSGASLMPNVRISGADVTIQNMIVLGNLDQTAGNLGITNCLVGGSCTLAGNSVSDVGGGLLDAFGALSFQTTSVVNNPPETISCSGAFSASATFQPLSGLVSLDAPGVQAVTRTAFTWHDLHIESGTQVVTLLPIVTTGELVVRGELGSTGGTIECHGQLSIPGTLASTTAPLIRAHAGLTVGGTMFAPAARLDVDGNVSITGFADVGVGEHRITGSMAASGSFSMAGQLPVIFDGTGAVNLGQSSPVAAVRFAGGDYEVTSLRVTGNLEHVSGALTIGTCNVGGNGSFLGATFSGLPGAVLDIGGNVIVQTGAPVTNPPATMRCGRDWTSNASFAPASGLVEFDGSGDQVVIRPSFSWHDLRIKPGAVVYSTLAANIAGILDIQGQLNAFGPSVNVGGNLNVRATGLLQAGAATSITAIGPMQVDGSLIAGSAALSSQADVLVTSSGAVLLGAGPHSLNGSLAVLGSWQVPPASTTRFLGAGQVNVTAGSPLGNVAFLGGNFIIGQVTALGNVTHTSGELRIATLTCGGNASFQGAALVDFAGGLVDVAGSLTIATSGLVANPPSQIRCGGNWTSNALFAPVAGVVEMVGTTPQTMNSAQLQLATLLVGAGANVSFAANDVVIVQDLNLDGSLAAPAGQLQIGDDLQVGAAGALHLQPTTACSIAGSVANLGAITGGNHLSLVGAGALSGTGDFPGLSVAALGDYTVSGAVAVVGDLAVSSGALALEAAASMSVSGNLNGIGGTLRGAPASLLDVDGDAVIDGMLADAAGSPDLTVGGDLHCSSAFAPLAGTITLDGTGDLLALDGSLALPDLVIAAGARQIADDMTAAATSIAVSSGAALDLGGRRLEVTTPAISVAGQLRIGTGGTLFLGPLTAVDISTTGSLQMLGSWDEPASVDGPVGGDYSFVIDGAFEALNFVFAHMGPAGIRITQTADLGSAPNDLRGGRFLDGSAAPGSCLLHIDRDTPAELRYITLASAGTTYGVRSLGSAQVSFVNESGSRSGPAFEDDAGNVVQWLPAERTDVASFTATASVHSVALAIATAREVDVQTFRLLRAQSAAGPFVEISSFAATGTESVGASYSRTDSFVVDNTRYIYRLEEILTHGEPRQLAEDFARPWPDRVGNMTFVGPNSAYPDLASALAVTPTGGHIAVQAGTYAAFTINKAVHIFPDGSGPVIIDTTLSKLVVRDIPASSPDLALYDLVVGGPASPFGMEVVNCDNIIVLDGLGVTVANGITGLLVDDCSHIAIQNCDLAGAPGLRFDNASRCYLSRGTVSSLEVLRNSHITYCDVAPGSMAVGIGSTADLLPGAMPDLFSPITWVANKPVPFSVTGEPNSFYVMLFSFRRSFIDMTPVFPLDMVLLLGQNGATTLTAGLIGPQGTAEFTLLSPGNPVTFGTNVPLQIVGLDLNGGRFGTSRDAVFTP